MLTSSVGPPPNDQVVCWISKKLTGFRRNRCADISIVVAPLLYVVIAGYLVLERGLPRQAKILAAIEFIAGRRRPVIVGRVERAVLCRILPHVRNIDLVAPISIRRIKAKLVANNW